MALTRQGLTGSPPHIRNELLKDWIHFSPDTESLSQPISCQCRNPLTNQRTDLQIKGSDGIGWPDADCWMWVSSISREKESNCFDQISENDFGHKLNQNVKSNNEQIKLSNWNKNNTMIITKCYHSFFVQSFLLPWTILFTFFLSPNIFL